MSIIYRKSDMKWTPCIFFNPYPFLLKIPQKFNSKLYPFLLVFSFVAPLQVQANLWPVISPVQPPRDLDWRIAAGRRVICSFFTPGARAWARQAAPVLPAVGWPAADLHRCALHPTREHATCGRWAAMLLPIMQVYLSVHTSEQVTTSSPVPVRDSHLRQVSHPQLPTYCRSTHMTCSQQYRQGAAHHHAGELGSNA